MIYDKCASLKLEERLVTFGLGIFVQNVLWDFIITNTTSIELAFISGQILLSSYVASAYSLH